MGKREKALVLYIVEHNTLAASSLRRVLGHKNICFVNAQDLSPITISLEKTVILVDASTLGMAIEKFVPLIRLKLPQSRVLVIAESIADDLCCRLLACGAHGFLRYDQLDRLPIAIRTLTKDHLWVKPAILEQYVERAAQTRRTGISNCVFTSREREILPLLQCRQTNKEISFSVRISERTVKFHVANICRKLGVHGRDLVIAALQCSGAEIFGLDPADISCHEHPHAATG
jgi:DNA-binding NarL/FixJ family response regulator